MHGRYLVQYALRLASSIAGLLMFPLLVVAHPEGGEAHRGTAGIVHFITSPDHLAQLLAAGIFIAVAATIAAAVLIRRRRE